MFKEVENGSCIDVPDNAFGFIYKCQLPPVGYGVNVANGKLQQTDILKSSEVEERQMWVRPHLPADYHSKRKKEKENQKINSSYIDPYLEDIRKKEWKRRLCGIWFWNYNPKEKKSELIYITGLHYLYITYWKFQGKHMDFRIPDRDLFYVIAYISEDDNCLGLNEITKRKNGKTARLGCWLYERTSRMNNHHGGIQSKADDDAQEVFMKAVRDPWKTLPDFFRPVYDTMKGDSPSDELRFFATSRRGSKTEIEDTDAEEALNSFIDFKASSEAAYDGPELHSYASDESGKCFGLGTKIRMYNGEVKNVEEITNGEIVMGDNSTPRTVYGVTSGVEKMYKIVPKKGDSWNCNESHILSLKWCTKRNELRNWNKYQVVNISVKDYIGLKKWEQNHLVLYRNKVEYKESKINIDPYLFGLWLGDGNKDNLAITTTDTEVVDYINKIAKEEGLSVNKIEGITYYLGKPSRRTVVGDGVFFPSITSANIFYGYNKDTQFDKTAICEKLNLVVDSKKRNRILDELTLLNVRKNKHIPKSYLINSTKNRMDLLAGIIDSDGHICLNYKNKFPRGIEITQKIETLAKQIKELAIGLGFYASINPKKAKMKRIDNTIYECIVYRVCIYGDLWKIPTKVKRKQVPKIDFHVNRRNPSHSGFSIEDVGLGNYYGFAVDGNSLFLLEDGTVVHNTKKPVSIKERQNVVRYCTEIDGKMMGKHYFTTTVEPEKGEEENYEFQELTANSNPLERDDNGRTGTGLYTYFLPAFKGMFFDEYGYPREEDAKIFLLNTRKSLQDKGDTRGLSSFKRKNPLNLKEAFSADGAFALYNPELLNQQLDEISWRNDLTEKGNFVWKDGYKFERPIEKEDGTTEWVLNEVEWVADANGRFEKVKGWNPKDANKVFKLRGKFSPNNNFAIRIGCDPFKYDKTKDKRRSNCAAYAYQIKDDLFPNDIYNDTFVLRYAHRADSTRLSNEDVLMMAWYCGCQVLFERNINHWKKDFYEWNCEGFLMWLPGEVEPGISTDGAGNVVQMICNYTESYINEHIKKVYFKTLIRKNEGWLGFKVEDTQSFDEPMGAGFTLIAVKGKKYQRKQESKKDIESVMPYRKAV